MKSDRVKWNEKHRSADSEGLPSALVTRFAPWARRERALDIAAGSGRHALFLSGLGFTVDAVDISEIGLGKITHPKINRICSDLDTYDIAPGTYDLIVNVNFLLRRLFPLIVEGLRPGGILIFETFIVGHPPPAGKSYRREYLLRENELLRTFLPLQIVYYREWCHHDQRDDDVRTAGLVGIKPA
jgi:tellurite methyltransferase